jgi:hypothetical protein
MLNLQRRKVLLGSSVFVPLVLLGCSTTPGGTPSVSLDMAKAYLDDLVNAVSAAAQAYLAGSTTNINSATVAALVADLQALNSAVQSITDVTNIKSISLQILAAVNQVVPFVAPFLGPAGPFVPLAIAVIQAFVQSLPAPPDAPPQPPAQLHAKAMTYRGKK